MGFKIRIVERFPGSQEENRNNNASREHGIETVGGYESYAPYAVPEEELKAVGYDVLVFVPWMAPFNPASFLKVANLTPLR